MIGSSFVADDATGLDAWINEGAQKLHEKLIQAFEDDYVEKTSAVAVVAGTTDYSLPSDFVKLLGFEVLYQGQYIPLERFQRRERGKQAFATVAAPDTFPKYRLAGSKLRVMPASQAWTGRLVYCPALQVLQGGSGSTYINLLTGASDTVDFPNGWERYVVAYAAKQALMKEESPVGELGRELDQMDQELKSIIELRDIESPRQAVDVEGIRDAFLWVP